jgi:hypothetical protein
MKILMTSFSFQVNNWILSKGKNFLLQYDSKSAFTVIRGFVPRSEESIQQMKKWFYRG